jgi:anhydro-N-acetylmuramic acid kinase
MAKPFARPLRALGLMSGTSLDGIDAALIETDGERVTAMGAWLTQPYEPPFREAIRAVLGGQGDIPPLERALTEAHGAAVKQLLGTAGLAASEVDVIGFHGHTILHWPRARRPAGVPGRATWQIGDGALLARLTGIDVVNDMRTADVEAGGEGAPLAPVFHRALGHGLGRPLAVLNVGGISNVTWIGVDDQLVAFDTGPGNALLDDWALRHTGRPVDLDGRMASAGRVDQAILQALLADPWFDLPPPKSLDRLDFGLDALAALTAEDGAATLAAFTAQAVALALAHMPAAPQGWLVTGGGRRNPALMAALREALKVAVRPVEEVGWNGDALEAQAFAYLAVRSLAGLPLSYTGTTGVPRPTSGGVLHRAGKRPIARRLRGRG